jgi:hypothetical protein
LPAQSRLLKSGHADFLFWRCEMSLTDFSPLRALAGHDLNFFQRIVWFG